MKKFIAFVLSLFIVTSGLAQTRPGTTTGGGTGSTTGGGRGTGTGTGTAGGSGGLTNFGSSGFGTTGSTSGATSGQANGISSFGQGFTFNSGLGLGGSAMGMTGMGGMGRSGFGGMGMGMGGMGMGMGMGGMGMGMGGGGRGGNTRGGAAGGQQQYQIRPTVKLGFTVQAPSSTQRTQQFTSTIARLPQPERFAGVNVKVEGRKAIATGKLANSADAKLLKNLLLMEPGIYEVDTSAITGEKKNTSPSDRLEGTAEQIPAVPVPK